MSLFSLPAKMKLLILLGGDIALFYFSLWLTLQIRYGIPLSEGLWQQHFFPFSLLYIFWLGIFYVFGLYDFALAKNTASFYATFSRALILCALAAIVFFYFIPLFSITPKTNLFLHLVLFSLFFAGWRQIYNAVLRHPLLSQNIAVIGKSEQARELASHILANPQFGYKIRAIINPQKEELDALLQTHSIHLFLMGRDLSQYPDFAQILFRNLSTFAFQDFSLFYEHITGKVPLSHISEIWFLNNFQESNRRLYETIKNLFDIAAALCLGIVFVALLPLIALAIVIESPGPVFYRQARVGKNGKPFMLWKFRSMIPNAENGEALWAEQNDARVTRVGNLLRKPYLDELPQCINILRGDMSFVGPRPERPEFVALLEQEIPFYQIRHLVKPGLTGWAQIHFPYGNSKEGALEKLQFELYYIKNRSALLDLKILLKTINVVFKDGTQ